MESLSFHLFRAAFRGAHRNLILERVGYAHARVLRLVNGEPLPKDDSDTVLLLSSFSKPRKFIEI